MSRILRRPMFRGGGKVSSYGNGIATGLAGGGRVNLNIGGSPFGAPIIKVPQATQTTTGGNILNKNVGRMSGMASKGANLLKNPAFSEAGIMQGLKKLPALGDKIAKYGTNLVKRFPALTYGMAGEYVTRPQDVDKVIYEQEGYSPFEGRIRQILDPTYMSKMKKVYEQGYNEDGKLNALINQQIEDNKDPALEAAEDNPNKEIVVDVEGEPVLSKKERLEKSAKEYEDILGAGIKKDSIFDAMIEGGTRLYEGEGAGAAIRAANKALDPIQNIKTASRKLALEEDIAIRKALAVAKGKSNATRDLINQYEKAGLNDREIANRLSNNEVELPAIVQKMGSKPEGYKEFVRRKYPGVNILQETDPKKIDTSVLDDGRHYITYPTDAFIEVKDGKLVGKIDYR